VQCSRSPITLIISIGIPVDTVSNAKFTIVQALVVNGELQAFSGDLLGYACSAPGGGTSVALVNWRTQRAVMLQSYVHRMEVVWMHDACRSIIIGSNITVVKDTKVETFAIHPFVKSNGEPLSGTRNGPVIFHTEHVWPALIAELPYRMISPPAVFVHNQYPMGYHSVIPVSLMIQARTDQFRAEPVIYACHAARPIHAPNAPTASTSTLHTYHVHVFRPDTEYAGARIGPSGRGFWIAQAENGTQTVVGFRFPGRHQLLHPPQPPSTPHPNFDVVYRAKTLLSECGSSAWYTWDWDDTCGRIVLCSRVGQLTIVDYA